MRVDRGMLGIAIALFVGASSSVHAQQSAEPWKEPQDTAAALFDSDRYAWKVFVALNWPANVAGKQADSAKPFGTPGSVVWETWRNVRPDAPDTVFRRDGADPGPWLGGGGPGPVVAREEREFVRAPVKKMTGFALRPRGPLSAGISPQFDEPVADGGNEVRLNETAYTFIKEKELFNIEGQIKKVNEGIEILKFPPNTKEIKATWRRLTNEADKNRYHWTEVARGNGSKEVWGLTALHISTKVLPNWLWMTFEHIDNKQGGAWELKSVDRFACPTAPYDCEQAPSGIGRQGTKWENYRLRGTQTDFVDTKGVATKLANSKLEAIQARSSCITCHALATIDKNGSGLNFAFVVGPPPTDWFLNQNRERLFMQLDFMWALTQASNRN
ncbi:hypothetical protein [Bradyrhizobium liaoningense]|uniref:hypothetical protein n=1 Tax=Bradyrhizobium liaoningense TaxID=43992 RepID=UPI001BAD6078|nr:hypothetical protein [Bradyrhizobium liaoningense]MBR1032816.1 hypothetical protein [Bradyrhizobium liaoningense]